MAIDDDDDSSSDDDGEEDDDGFLANGALDAQVQQTLDALRKKDPRVYDLKTKFYAEDADEEANSQTLEAARKPMHLSDYHRRNLLEQMDGGTKLQEQHATYAETQNDLKAAVTREIHAAADSHVGHEPADGTENEDDFLVRKHTTNAVSSTPKEKHMTKGSLDVDNADKDPEGFLNDFLSARAWVPNERSQFQAFESDDEEEERRADEFEDAYNLRFENAETQNEKIITHARDAVAKYSVRKEAANPRQRARELERSKKEQYRQSAGEEKARLRKLKIAELETKMLQIQDAAGFGKDIISDDAWSRVLEGAWEDEDWDVLMTKHFGTGYYQEKESKTDTDGTHQSRKLKKPKWEDDIDVRDIVPDFDEQGQVSSEAASSNEELDEGVSLGKAKPGPAKKDISDSDRKRQARLEHRKIEQVVDENLDVEDKLSKWGQKHKGHFRYRETSPISWGMTALDILMADDSQLNDFAGLKKLAAFRDPEKKRRDKKRLGKKARLRNWRQETFGSRSRRAKEVGEPTSDTL